MKWSVVALVALSLGGCVSESFQVAAPGDLPPIRSDYKGAILAWARTYGAERRPVRNARISDPTLVRDSTGRLVWLVCVEADWSEAAGPYRFAPQAFGFAPDYVSSPLERRGSSLTRQDCDRPLQWRRFPQLVALR